MAEEFEWSDDDDDDVLATSVTSDRVRGLCAMIDAAMGIKDLGLMMGFLAADSERHGSRVDPQGYEERLSLADANGTDDPRGRSAEDLMSFNRAGPGETCLPVGDLVRSFWGEDESGKVAEFPEG